MTVDYRNLLQSDVTRILTPLADAAREREKELAALTHRIGVERANAEALAGRLERLKGTATASLTSGQGGYEQYRRSLRKLTGELDASREMIRAMTDELLPQARRELDAARERVQQAVANLAEQHRPVCENAMGILIGAVVDERDAFMAAVDAIAAENGTSYAGQARIVPDGCFYAPDPQRKPYMTETSLSEGKYDPAISSFNRKPRGQCPTRASVPRQDPSQGPVGEPGGTIPPPDDSQDPLEVDSALAHVEAAPTHAPEAPVVDTPAGSDGKLARLHDPGADRDCDLGEPGGERE